MIKICSLDFLNKENFGTDVMTADGKVLFHSDEKITPELILKLYFKEIYVDESFFKEESEIAEKNIEIDIAAINKIEESVLETGLVEANTINEETAKIPRFIEAETKNEELSLSGPIFVEANAVNINKENVKGPRSIETEVKNEEASSGPRFIEAGAVNVSEETVKGPRFVETNEVENKEKKSPLFSTENSADKNPENENIKKDPENEPLVFDEKQAKRIVEHSIKIGKILNFSDTELKELEQVAYNYNIGITRFKKADLSKKGFRKMKVFASYEKLLNEENVSEKIVEMVKLCANNYESNAFPLNSKIPYYHIVGITSFYEELLSQNNSKQTTLFKMLQMGGNQFNIFILHKFIKLMREAND